MFLINYYISAPVPLEELEEDLAAEEESGE